MATAVKQWWWVVGGEGEEEAAAERAVGSGQSSEGSLVGGGGWGRERERERERERQRDRETERQREEGCEDEIQASYVIIIIVCKTWLHIIIHFEADLLYIKYITWSVLMYALSVIHTQPASFVR